MELVMYVSADFGIRVDPREVTPENFDSVNRLALYIRTKQTTGSVAGVVAG